VFIALIIKAIITALPARPIAELVRISMAPPIMPPVYTMIISTDLTSAPVCAEVDVRDIVVALSVRGRQKLLYLFM
jgi:hypothetical protein